MRAGGERYLYQVHEEQKNKQNNSQEPKGANDDAMDIDWHDFVIVEEINLYEESEMGGLERRQSISLDESVQMDLKR